MIEIKKIDTFAQMISEIRHSIRKTKEYEEVIIAIMRTNTHGDYLDGTACYLIY